MVVLAPSQTHISLAWVAVLKQADSSMFFYELNITIDWTREALPSKDIEGTFQYIYQDLVILMLRY